MTNVERRFTGGTSDSPLTENGIAQARELGKSLEHISFDAVYSSTLKRAVDTVKIAFGDKYEINTDERLIEIRLGVMEGMKDVDASEKYPESGLLFFTDPVLYKPPPGGEILENMVMRIGAFIDDLKCKNYSKVFILTHGYALRVFYACMADRQVATIAKAPAYPNCSLAHYILENEVLTCKI
jgi:probable phosphoglycerate mutase